MPSWLYFCKFVILKFPIRYPMNNLVNLNYFWYMGQLRFLEMLVNIQGFRASWLVGHMTWPGKYSFRSEVSGEVLQGAKSKIYQTKYTWKREYTSINECYRVRKSVNVMWLDSWQYKVWDNNTKMNISYFLFQLIPTCASWLRVRFPDFKFY